MVLKFRAWHKEQKRMIETDDIVAIDLESEYITEQEIYYTNEGIPERDLNNYDFNELEIMQSTGLYDKHGIEIYEGDVVEYENEIGMIKTSCVVWGSDYAQFRLVNKNSEPIDSRPLLGRLTKKYSKVIGNKYEHPELLKGDERR